MRKLLITITVATVAFIGYANSGPRPDSVGITPWDSTDRDRASDVRIMRNRVGPVACPKWHAQPAWKKLIVRNNSWCGEWLKDQEQTAQR